MLYFSITLAQIRGVLTMFKAKLIQLGDLLKKVALWAFKVALKALKVAVEETIIVLQALDKFLTNCN